jgi:hypothetical protein
MPFLSLMANLAQRFGWAGGNSQGNAEFRSALGGYALGVILVKDNNNMFNPTATTSLKYTDDLFSMLSRITDFVIVRWYLGASPILSHNHVNLGLQVCRSTSSILYIRTLSLLARPSRRPSACVPGCKRARLLASGHFSLPDHTADSTHNSRIQRTRPSCNCALYNILKRQRVFTHRHSQRYSPDNFTTKLGNL